MKINSIFVLWYLLVLSFTVRNHWASGFIIPDAVYEYCPYSDICNKTASRGAEGLGQEMVPCCGSCACDDDCGQRLDCCFDEMDKYKLVQKQIVACIAPVLGSSANVNDETSYTMVQACNKYSNGETVNKSCTLNDDFGNSLVAPVSSLETGRIYINADCARCNNVREFTPWRFLYMPGARLTGFLVTSRITNVRNIEGSGVFVPPPNEDWSGLQCTKDTKTLCKKSAFKEMCENLHLPFMSVSGNLYENVFCYVCTLSSGFILDNLPRQCASKSRAVSDKMFTLLIDTSVFSLFTSSDIAGLTQKGVCLQLNDTCLQIHCPQGMLMTSKTCKYFIERWYTPFIVMQIKLLPAQGNTLLNEDMEDLSDQELQTPMSWITSPCATLRNATLSVYIKISPTKNGSVESFILGVIKNTVGGSFAPSTTILEIRRCFDNPWLIKVKNATYSFKASFDKYTNVLLHHSNLSLYQSWATFVADNKGSNMYRLISPKSLPLDSVQSKAGTRIKKTFWCKQVYLEKYHVTKMVRSIFIPSRNVTLGDNEYSENSDGDKSTYAVCIDDIDSSSKSGSTDFLQRFSLQISLALIAINFLFH